VDKPEDRHAWSRGVNSKLSKLEREVFLSGYEKVFLLFMDSCCICAECSGEREECKEPKLSRPAPEAMAVDVYTTVRQFGYPIGAPYRLFAGYEPLFLFDGCIAGKTEEEGIGWLDHDPERALSIHRAR